VLVGASECLGRERYAKVQLIDMKVGTAFAFACSFDDRGWVGRSARAHAARGRVGRVNLITWMGNG